MKKQINIIIMSALVLSSPRPTQTISQTTAALGTLGVATLVAAGSYYVLQHRFTYPYSPYNYLAIGALSGLAALATGYTLHSFTPAGRLQSAKNKLAALSRNPIALQSFNDDRIFYDALQEVYIADDLWLISSFNELSILLDEARQAVELAEKSRSEAAASNLLDIVHECNMISPHLRRVISNLAAALKRIRNNPEYVKQIKIHKEMLMAQQKLAIQQQSANAHTQMAMAQTRKAFRD